MSKETIVRIKTLTLHELIETLKAIAENYGEDTVMNVTDEEGYPIAISVVQDNLTDNSQVYDIVFESLESGREFDFHPLDS